MKLSKSQLIHLLSFYPKKRKTLFLSLDEADRSKIILKLPGEVQKSLLKSLSDQDVISIVEHLDTDRIVGLLAKIPQKRRALITQTLSESIQSDIELLSQFDPQTAAGLVKTNYIQVELHYTMRTVARQIRTYENQTGRSPAILVSKNSELVGYLPSHVLGLSDPSEKIVPYVTNLPKINHAESQQKILNIFKKNPHAIVAVIGKNNNVLGIIYSDDVLDLLDEHKTASLYKFAGVHSGETVSDPVSAKVKARYKWLMINLATAFMAASVVGLFEETISKYVLLAVYMPIVAGMGGNAGTQTLAVMVRGITLRQIELGNSGVALRRELLAGLVNGLINGLIVAVVVLVFNQDVRLAAVLALAMVASLTVAGFFGTLVPLIMQKLGKDPAASATVFITTATDVFGFMAFLGLAKLILN